MKKLLIGLTLLTSLSSFANVDFEAGQGQFPYGGKFTLKKTISFPDYNNGFVIIDGEAIPFSAPVSLKGFSCQLSANILGPLTIYEGESINISHTSTSDINSSINLEFEHESDFPGAGAWHPLKIGIGCSEFQAEGHATFEQIEKQLGDLFEIEIGEREPWQ